jgi:deoxyribodipyrimidine photo-lyase
VSVLWLRRDLRVADHPALLAAAADGPVTALFVLDDALLRVAGPARVAFLYRSLRALAADLQSRGGQLVLRGGRPEEVVLALAQEVGARSVHLSADFGPYGAARDVRVAKALGDIALVRTGSPYAVAPGRVTKGDGTPYRVYSAFYRAWIEHGWRPPAPSAVDVDIEWTNGIHSAAVPPDPPLPAGLRLPTAGEQPARAAWRAFRDERLPMYADERDRPDLDSTSRLSVYLHFGALHPRTLLAELGPRDEVFRKELAWREFYAAVLHFWPDSARDAFNPKMRQPVERPDERLLDAWREGRTGYPIVDAGMRQLLAEGWMHNRVRMIVASFLVKDLHVDWTIGARHFMRHLVDGDLASNQHGWQWTAGTGTDAAPFYRIFNPISQGKRFDPDGAYIRRFVPELARLDGVDVHEPWRRKGGPPSGYPAPIVDHAAERAVALARYRSRFD